MHIPLSGQGNPELPFITACAGRRIDLSGKEGEAHLLQLIPARWRSFGTLFEQFVTELTAVESQTEPDGTVLIEAFRRVIYDATELFDCYTNLLPKRITANSKKEREALADFRTMGRRLRSFTATLCNRCKHAGAQLQFLWGRSTTNGRTSARVLVQVYKDGTALLRDDEVHKGQMAGLGLVRITQELVHNLLRVDRAAGLLIGGIEDRGGEVMPDVGGEVSIGVALKRLSELEATRHSDEGSMHYGLAMHPNSLELVRVTAADLGPHVHMQATFTHHLPTRSYSIA